MNDYYYEPETGAYSFPPDDEDGDDTYEDIYEADADDDFDADGTEPIESHDLSDDGDALASAGWGTDEDYGYDGGDEW